MIYKKTTSNFPNISPKEILKKIFNNESLSHYFTDELITEFANDEYDENGLETISSRKHFVENRIKQFKKQLKK